jgi:serine/threonine-protein kinase HipA
MIGYQHFISTAKEVGFSLDMMEKILHEMATNADQVINNVARELPREFPSFISGPIFDGIQRYSNRLLN